MTADPLQHPGSATGRTLPPVVPRPLSDAATETLRTAILQGTLAPGMRLVERDLAGQLAMSRIPLREAIRRLVAEGLITKIPHRGVFVYTLTPQEIEDISSLRVVLEQFVMERIIPRLRPEHVTQLLTIVDQMRAAASTQDAQRLYEHDLEFHRALWTVADHPLLLEMVSNLRSRINWFLHEAARSTASFQFDQYIAAHEELIDVLRGGDVARARTVIAQHIQDSKIRILAAHGSSSSE